MWAIPKDRRGPMSRPCSCGGSNENCMHCFGRGFVGTDRGQSNGRPRMRKAKRRLKVPLVVCPTCGFKGTRDALEQHIPQAHFKSAQFVILGLSKKVESKPRTKCTICGVTLRSDRVARHNRRVHAPNVAATFQGPGPTKKSGKTGRRFGDKLVSSAKRSQRGRKERPDRKDLGGLDKWKASIQASQSPNQPNLDFTKPYAHANREHGKFGSHPSHDGFDDESNA